MWFSPLKGAHLTLGQLDKTLPVDISAGDNKKIERGTFVYIANGTGTTDVPQFKIYTAEQATKANAVPYIALMGVYDFQAGMAGNVGQAPVALNSDGTQVTVGTAATDDALKFIDKPTLAGAQAVSGPRITAISIVQAGEYQTSAYTGTGFYVGQPLTVGAEGKLVAWETGKHIVGYVTATPKTRWVNDLGASVQGARISGGNASVIEFSTAWIPAAATEDNTAKTQQAVTAEKKAAAATPVASAPKAATTK
jgi:hypothetical protein